jgi:hypothetical protein
MSPKPPSGRSLEELTTPHGDFAPSVRQLDTMFERIEVSLNAGVPEELKRRITTTRNLAVYGGFSYDLSAVSYYWALTCIEMALWFKSQQIDPKRHHKKITMKPLLDWAQKEKLMPKVWSDPKAAEMLAQVRNGLAHPKDFNTVLMPGDAYRAFVMLVEVVNSLWP